ncbi:hypothetical protein [Streptomyces sp. NPDC052291]|uniref:effector-associated constant component EACC1 n=1 Tax=Streptomyces sp. NPDC052291 TaxID=3161011 RepID=UPI00342567E7
MIEKWPIEAQITVTDSAERMHLESLDSWLRMDSSFRGRTKLSGTPSENDLGTAVELLTVAIGSGGVISVLAASLSSWFQQPKRTDITLKVTRPNGKSVEIHARRATLDEITKLLHETLETGEGATE